MAATRLQQLQTELTDVRADIAAARSAVSVGVGGHSLTRQRIAELERREQTIALTIQRMLRGGRPLGSTAVRF